MAPAGIKNNYCLGGKIPNPTATSHFHSNEIAAEATLLICLRFGGGDVGLTEWR